jgi:capsular polysaccharide biosynthesis protein
MNRHLLRVLLALYPRAWRDRYGTELAGLTEDLISAGEITLLAAVVNLTGGAALEWGRVLAGSRFVVGEAAVAGLVAGIVFAALHPPLLTSTALVVLPQSAQSVQAAPSNDAPDPYTATQEVVAGSYPVLVNALPNIRPAMSLNELRHIVQIGSPSPSIVSVSAKGENTADAEATANAVADSYISYVSSSPSPAERLEAQMLESATSATGRPLPASLLITGGFGALCGAIVGAAVVLAFGWADRRLRITGTRLAAALADPTRIQATPKLGIPTARRRLQRAGTRRTIGSGQPPIDLTLTSRATR